MVDGPDRHLGGAWHNRPGLVVAGLFALAMIPLLATPVLPLIDFYNHLARFFVLAHIAQDPFLQAHYQVHWSLLPDIGVDVLATPLLYMVPPLPAGHVIAIAILANLYASVLAFQRALTGRQSFLAAVLLLPLLYSYVLNWGFANFLLGLGFAFWAAAWWLRHRERPRLAVPVGCILALAIFFSHGIAFVLFGLLLGSLELGFFFNAKARAPADLGRSLALLAIQAILPVGFFLFWKAGVAPDAAADVSSQATPLFFSRLANGIANHFPAVVRVEEGPALWFDAATLIVQIVAILFLIRRGTLMVARPSFILIAVALILALLPVPTMFGVGHIADRLPLFAALVFLGSVSALPGSWSRASRWAASALIVTVAIRLAVVAFAWHGTGEQYREYRSIAARIPRHSLTIPIMVGAGRHETDVPRCEMYGPLAIAQFEQAGPLFADEKQQPLLLAGSLQQAVTRLDHSVKPPEPGMAYNSYIAAAAFAGFDYMLMCNAQLLARPFPANTHLVARTPHFVLLRAVKQSATRSRRSK